MSFWFLVQVLVNLVLFAGIVAMWIRLNRPQKDDPRLSKGLQLLQSKIAVLEDLSDRTEVQVSQLTSLLEQKCKEIQTKIQASEKQLAKIDQSTQKSLEVAKIFQDRIPHTEILERQNTIKYVKAAKLAHQGLSYDEIAEQVDLSRGEIEFIAKVNKDQLMFCEDSLPEWAQQDEGLEPSAEGAMLEMPGANPFQSLDAGRDLSKAFEVPQNDQQALRKLGEAFKAACADTAAIENAPNPTASAAESAILNGMEAMNGALEKTSAVLQTSAGVLASFAATAGQSVISAVNPVKPAESAPKRPTPPPANGVKETAPAAKTPNIRPVQFRRIDMAKDLG